MLMQARAQARAQVQAQVQAQVRVCRCAGAISSDASLQLSKPSYPFASCFNLSVTTPGCNIIRSLISLSATSLRLMHGTSGYSKLQTQQIKIGVV